MTILCYHTVDPHWRSALAVNPTEFERHCAWLARNRRVVSLTDAVRRLSPSGRLAPRTVAITFDDGFAGVHEHALPALRRHGLPATVFVVAETLTPRGRAVDWVEGPTPGPPPTLSADQILALKDAGVHIGSHGYAHRDLASMTEDECERDLRDSRELLEDVVREPVRMVAYPRGRHDQRVWAAARRAGYSHGFTLPERREPVGRFSIPRVGVYPGNGTVALRAKSSPWYPGVRTGVAWPVLRAALPGGPVAPAPGNQAGDGRRREVSR